MRFPTATDGQSAPVTSVGMKILIVGAEAAGARALRAVQRGAHRIAAVVTDDYQLASSAAELGVPVFPAMVVRTSAFADWIERRDVDILLNVHSLHVVESHVLQAPAIGSFNLHPGPLPQYSGLMAPSWAIFNGESSHAVTLHWMDAGVDTGPIASAASFRISENDTGLSVSARCVSESIPLLTRLLEDAATEPASIRAMPQSNRKRTYFSRQPPNDGAVSWGWGARQVVDFVRACDYLPLSSPWGHPRARLGDREILLLRAARTHASADADPGTVASINERGALVASGDEWIRLDRVEIGGKVVRASKILSPGDRLSDGAAGECETSSARDWR